MIKANRHFFEGYVFEWNQKTIAGHIFTPDSQTGENLFGLPIMHSFYIAPPDVTIYPQLVTTHIGVSIRTWRDNTGLIVKGRFDFRPDLDPDYIKEFRRILPMLSITPGTIRGSQIKIDDTTGEVYSFPIFSFTLYQPLPNQE